jgi:glycosyltransferase involved in cell wall biosynthesis
MRICLIGGIFGKSAEYRAHIQQTPETTLAIGLEDRGHTVATFGHYDVPSNDYDIIHVHHFGLGALRAAASSGDAALIFTNHAFRHLDPLRRWATRYVLERSAASVVLSEAEAAWQRREYVGAQFEPRVIPNGVDEGIFRYSVPSPPAGTEPWRLLYVGQLTRSKGVEDLLHAVALLQADLSVELTLVYHIAEREDALRNLASRLGVRSLSFLGARTPEQLAALYARHHALVLPSFTEALPTVISEALLVGRPVVATEVGGIPEQVGSFGTTVSPGDARDLAYGIRRTFDRFADLSAESRAARDEAARRYSVRAMIDAHEALYRECANKAGDGTTSIQRGQDRVMRSLVRWSARHKHN